MPETAPNPELIFETAQAYQRTAALAAAVDLDLFTAIEAGASTVPDIAKACGASERGTRMLCDYLTIMGFLIKDNGRYRATPDTAMFLSKRSPAYMGGMLAFLNAPHLTKNFGHLADTIRRGTVSGDENTVSPENPIWQTFARAMMPMAMPTSQAVAAIVGPGKNGALRVLDIAAGHGLFGIAIARQNPGAQVVAVDWAAVLEVAMENAKRMGVGDRVSPRPGDAFTVDWGTGYDLALVTNFLHHFDAPSCTAFLKKIRQSLNPGGRVAVVEFVPNDDRISPPLTASFVLNMLAGTPSGDAYTFAEINDMLRAAGFSRAERHALPGPQTVVVGYA